MDFFGGVAFWINTSEKLIHLRKGINMKYGSMPGYFYEDSVDDRVIDAFTKTLLDLGSPDDVFGMFNDACITGEDAEIDYEEWFGYGL